MKGLIKWIKEILGSGGLNKFLITSGILKVGKHRTRDEEFAVFVVCFSSVLLIALLLAISEKSVWLFFFFSLFLTSWVAYWLYKSKGKTYRRALFECLFSPIVFLPLMIIVGIANTGIFIGVIINQIVSDTSSCFRRDELLWLVGRPSALFKRFLSLLKENPVMNGNS
ncbi:MAG: hypothetical protein GTN40_05025 [Candidatus Aenigmarchaeota archaeon]|nr:hypothetical protein [Candidatus Aenigmarchaeota archaeon]